jgi:hypothetical protein
VKHCTSCLKEKPFLEFAKNGKYYRNKCKVCTRPQVNAWYEDNKETHLANTAKWASNNQDKRKAIGDRYRESNLESCRKRCREWQKQNPDKIAAIVAKRRASKLNATPSWLTQEHYDQIKHLYAHAKECEMLTGDKYHVDHIVPLQGKNVSGLHVPWNLQVLPADINIKKSNSHGKETF